MKKKFIAKKSKKRMRLKWLAFGAVAILSCIFTIKILAHFTLKTSQEDFLRFLLENQNAFVKNSRSNYSYFHQLMTKIIDLDITDPLSILNTNYKGMTSSDEIKEEPEATTTLKDPNPKEVEDKIYNMWLEGGYFKGVIDPNKQPFTIVIPPPNVTAQLHIGHACDDTLQDILIRYKRMQGYAALWLPGTDHAGIATQIKVEEKLRKEEKTQGMR